MRGIAGGLCSLVRPGRGAGGASMVLCFVSRKLPSSHCILTRRNFHDLKNESPDGRGTVGTVPRSGWGQARENEHAYATADERRHSMSAGFDKKLQKTARNTARAMFFQVL